MPTTRTALPATPRMATSCTLSPTHQVVSRQRQFHPSTWSERHRLLQSVPVPRNQVFSPARPTHRTALPAISPHRSSSTRSLHLRPAFLHLQLLQATESTRLTSAGSTLVPTRTASAVQPTSRTALRATSRTESCSTLYASVPACIAPGAVPSGYGLNSTGPNQNLPLRGCSLHNLRCQRLELLGLQVGRRIPARPVHRDSILRSLSRNPSRLRSQLERQHQSVPMLRSYCIACSANASNCSVCDFALNGYLLDPLVPPTCVKTPNFPSGYGLNSADYTKVYPCSDSHCVSCYAQLLELLCLQHREWLPLCTLSPTHQVVSRQRQFHPSTV